jgi:hypothetical protein
MNTAREIKRSGQDIWLLLDNHGQTPIIEQTTAIISGGLVEFIYNGDKAAEVMQDGTRIYGRKSGVLGYAATYDGARVMQRGWVQEQWNFANSEFQGAQAMLNRFQKMMDEL